MEVFGVIYKITNLINGKVYIGQTVNSIKKRFMGHIKESNNLNTTMPVARAIRKYGKENFTIEEVCKAYSREELNTLEATHIKQLKSNSNLGYNICEITDNQVCKSKETIEKFKAYRNLPENKKRLSELGRARRGFKPVSKSIYRGVQKKNKWIARISIDNKMVHVGSFDTEIEAAQARDLAELNYSGDKAVLNFPELKEKYLSGEISPKSIERIKKSNSSFLGVYFCSTSNRWIFKLKGYKVKRFLVREDAEAYSELVRSLPPEKRMELELRKSNGNLPGVYYSNTYQLWVARTKRNGAMGFKTKEEAEAQILQWKQSHP